MSAIVLTACTNRKRRTVEARLTAESLAFGSMSDVAADWLSRIAHAGGRVAANRLYCGRSFVEAGLAARRYSAPLFVVSAGLGLVDSDSEIPCYNLTVSNGAPDNVLGRVKERGASAADWWRLVSQGSCFAESLEELDRRYPSGPILVALSGVYLLMIEADLVCLPERALDRLRIFARGADAIVDGRLGRYVMPYDRRLDGEESPIRGTLGDFAQRAARHFAEVTGSGNGGGTPEQDQATVAKALALLTAPQAVLRQRVTNDELKGLIRESWGRAGGQAARMLRVLRDDLRVACEQRRFRALFREVRAEKDIGI